MDPQGKGKVRHPASLGPTIPSIDPEQRIRAYDRTLAVLDAMAAISTLSLEEIASRVVGTIQQGLDFEHLRISLVNEENGELEPLGCDTESYRVGEKSESPELCKGKGLVGWVAEQGIACRVRDVSQDSRHATVDSPWPPDVRSVMIIPLTFGEQVIGVIDAASSRLDAFSEADEYLMNAVARQLAVAIENARRYQETERQLAEVSALYKLAQQINTSLNIQEVLESIVWSLKQTMGCRGCSIALLDPVTNVLEIRTAVGVEHKWEHDFKLRLGEGVAGRVALEGKPIYVRDTTEQDDFIFFDQSVRSLLTVPLTLQQRVIGALTVDSDRPGAFGKPDERLLTIAATQAAIAIENARLYASLEQRAQNLAEAYAELKRADRLKDEIVQNISHELRTPLTFVKGYVEMLLDESAGPMNAIQKQYLGIVVEKTNVVTRLVSDIMTLQQTEAVPSRRVPVSLAELARRAVLGCMATAENAGLALVENIADDLPLATGDEDRLLQVFDNLLGNAIKFSPDGGQIIVAVQDAGDRLRVSVSDQGIGIPRDQHERIFERFYQIDGSARRRFGGTGLGLAIVKRIVEAHEGEVWVESEPGRGSTFYFTVPKYQEPHIG
jgi:signal transduction histidine kinase